MDQTHAGHRQRMLARLLEHRESLNDHELLEILLFFSIPRVNTNELAHTLLSSFQNLDGVMRASYEQLLSINGIGKNTAMHILCLQEVLRRIKGVEKEERRDALNMRNFSEWAASHLSALTTEVVEIFFFNNHQEMCFTRRFTDNCFDEASVNAEEINKLFASQRPHAVIVAHNHPDGASAPSDQDDMFTAQIQVICSLHGILLYDHIIVGTGKPYSYNLSGRLDTIRENFNINNLSKRKDLM